jgi:pimeloyl-ACP methyl ester carboxylesterase
MRSMGRALELLVVIGLGVGLPESSRLEASGLVPGEPGPGVVFVVDGVGGFELLGSSAQKALPRGGVRHEIREFVWTHGWGQIFKDLQDTPHLLRKAEELAAEVRLVKAQQPERPVYLLAKSGGTALVLAAAEQLPPQTVERIIVLSAAVSRAYDLSGAFRATKGEIVSFFSPHDQFILGWGTRRFGTADRVHGPSAGLQGFIIPSSLAEADRGCYQRLVQIPWNPAMILEGHPGNHVGTSMPAFLAKEVAPWLKP